MNLDKLTENFSSKRILLTGNTGFKGTWLSHIFRLKGIDSMGYSDTDQGLGRLGFNPGKVIPTTIGSILEVEKLKSTIESYNPEIIIHFAAQSLVQKSYRNPRETFEVNVIGTYNVVEAALCSNSVETVLVITSDKVYLPNPSNSYLDERSHLGGNDPYSASKAAAELAIQSLKSINRENSRKLRLLTARAGNVIGGGDQAENRLLPDIIQSLMNGTAITLRNPTQIRPWQHVLESLAGYLTYLNKSFEDSKIPEALNFGPEQTDHITVSEVAKMALLAWGSHERNILTESRKLPGESAQILLDSGLARRTISWSPKWNSEIAVSQTIAWWRGFTNLCDKDAHYELFENDINQYFD